jgi:hypothetical protein
VYREGSRKSQGEAVPPSLEVKWSQSGLRDVSSGSTAHTQRRLWCHVRDWDMASCGFTNDGSRSLMTMGYPIGKTKD